MKKISSWILDNRLRLLLGSIFVFAELFIAVYPVGLGYNYKKLLMLICGLTWMGIQLRIPEKYRLLLGGILAALMPAVLITWLEGMTVTRVNEVTLFYNILIAYVIELIVLLCTLSLRFAVIGTSAFLTVLYTVNYFVYLYRGKAFTVNDLFAWKTAARVVGNYDFTPNNIMVVAWCLFFLFVVYAANAQGAASQADSAYCGYCGRAVGIFYRQGSLCGCGVLGQAGYYRGRRLCGSVF